MSFGSRAGDLVSGAFGVLLGALYLIQAVHLPFWTRGGNPGAGFLPTLLGVGLISMSLLLMVNAARERRADDQRSSIDRSALSKPLWALLAVVAYVFLLPVLGYLVSSVALLGLLLWVFDPEGSGARKAMRAAVFSLFVVALFYLVFVRLLALQIPVLPLSG